MEAIELSGTGRKTSRLGFGCSTLMGSMNESQSMSALKSAFDAGVRHFDTAPMYGFGESEACLGKFLKGLRAEVTITTKFGIPGVAIKPLFRMARAISPLIHKLRPAKKGSGGDTVFVAAKHTDAARQPNPIFTAEQAKVSLDTSLRRLRTERIDLWLLHEAHAVDLAADQEHDPLLRMMEDAVRAGKVGCFGVGSPQSAIAALVAQHSAYCAVTQYEWSAFDEQIPATPYFRIHHSSLSGRFRGLTDFLSTHSRECKEWSHEVGADLSSSDTLSKLMVRSSLVFNPESLVLFSSKRPRQIQSNAAVADQSSLDEPSRRLHEILLREQQAAAGQ